MKPSKNVLKAIVAAVTIASSFIGISICPLSNVNAQGVGINPSGSSANASAILDVNATNKGLLIPRVALTGITDVITIPGAVTSLLVYNTTTAGTPPDNVVPGYYYWNGTAWMPIITIATNVGDMQYWDGTKWVKISVGVPGQFLQLSNDYIPAWSGNAFPTVTTNMISNVTQNSAETGGEVLNDGGINITEAGVCWSTLPKPTIANNKTVDGWGIGPFYSSVTGLSGATTYYLRAYATNGVGTGYGYEVSFTTSSPVIPTVTTTAASFIAGHHAIGGGEVTDDGGQPVTTYGVCWNTSHNPTTLDSKTTDGSGTGIFTSSLSGLAFSTIYYVRAYATNAIGTAYGSEISFTTGSAVGIGDSYQGGVIAYILQTGDPGYISGQTHGLIAAPSDQSTGIQWYNGSFTTTGTTATVLGTGNANTNTIVTSQGNGNYAAKLCYDLVLNGFSDWYLPSMDELNKLMVNRVAIGGFTIERYWSSSEASSNFASYICFCGSYYGSINKSNNYYVRAVRSF